MTKKQVAPVLTSDIDNADRLIFALDVPTLAAAKTWVATLSDAVRFYKIGLELLASDEYFTLLNWLVAQGKKVFIDLKLFDVPETVGRTVARLNAYDATFISVHGNQAIMRAAADNKGALKVLAVTALTSLDNADLQDFGFKCDISELVIARAQRAFAAGCDGVVSSGLELKQLRQQVNNKLITVVPGIRPIRNTDDQKRVVDVKTAFINGADYIVIGRPIKNAPDPYQAAHTIQQTIATTYHQSKESK